jgi:hypothetical protein
VNCALTLPKYFFAFIFIPPSSNKKTKSPFNGQLSFICPVYVKEQLGHSSIQMTVDIYGHLIPNSNREAVNRLDNPHSNAPHPHPPKTEKPQPVEIVANS